MLKLNTKLKNHPKKTKNYRTRKITKTLRIKNFQPKPQNSSPQINHRFVRNEESIVKKLNNRVLK